MLLSSTFHATYASMFSMAFLALAVIAVSYLISALELKIKITSKGIQYKMVPFSRKKQVIRWNEIASCSIVESPIGTSADRRLIQNMIERKITLNGNNGISILTTPGDRYLIGTRNTKAVKKILKNVAKQNKK